MLPFSYLVGVLRDTGKTVLFLLSIQLLCYKDALGHEPLSNVFFCFFVFFTNDCDKTFLSPVPLEKWCLLYPLTQ